MRKRVLIIACPQQTHTPPPPDVEEAVGDSLAEVTGIDPLEPFEFADRAGGSSFFGPATDAAAVFENGDGVTQTSKKKDYAFTGCRKAPAACGALCRVSNIPLTRHPGRRS